VAREAAADEEIQAKPDPESWRHCPFCHCVVRRGDDYTEHLKAHGYTTLQSFVCKNGKWETE
jgi:uncharacterized C2H2 Zn-finger protein